MFEYFGDIGELHKDIEKYREKLTDIYAEILGREFPFIEQMSTELLVPENDPYDGSSHGATCVEDNNYFTVEFRFKHDLKISEYGYVSQNNGIAYPLPIHISRHGIKCCSESRMYGSLPKYLTPFLHEYNHFVLFCLQKCPDILAGLIAWTETEKHGHIDRINPTKNLNPEQSKWMGIYSHHFCVSEVSCDFLTATLMERLGFDASELTASPTTQEQLHSYGIRDADSLFDFTKNWNKRIHYTDGFQRNFFTTLERIHVEKKKVQCE